MGTVDDPAQPGAAALNLNPYGRVPPARKLGPIFVYDDPELAGQRAAWKLGQWLAGRDHDDPAGRYARFLWIALAAFAALLFDVGLIFRYVDVTPAVLLLTAAAPVFVLVSALRSYVRSGAATPRDCVREFVTCVNRGLSRRAWRLLTPLDRDNYTRAAPSVQRHDPVSVKRFAFDSRASFAAYWRAARSLGPATRLSLVAVTHQTRFLSPDLAVVTVQIHAQRSLRLQRDTLAHVVHKLVVRYGNEWRIFDGEVLSTPETNIDWVNELLVARTARE